MSDILPDSRTAYDEIVPDTRTLLAHVTLYVSVAAFASAATIVVALQHALAKTQTTELTGLERPLLGETARAALAADARSALYVLLAVGATTLVAGAAINRGDSP